VDLRVQVTYIYAPWRLLFTRDSTGSIFMILPKAGPALHQGDLIKVRGITTPGAGSNIVINPKFTVLGTAPLHARRLDLSRIHSADSEFVETEGILRPGPFVWAHASFFVADGPTLIWMTIPDVSDAQMRDLIGAKVRIRAVSSLLLDSAGRSNGVQLFVQNPNDVVPEDPRWQGLEYSRPQKIALVAPPLSGERFVRPVHLRGTLWWNGGNSLVLQDPSGTIDVIPAADTDAQPGALVDVIGFPQLQQGVLTMVDAAVTVERPGKPWSGLPLNWSASEAIKSGHDGQHVVLEGRVISQSSSGKASVFELEDGGTRFQVRVAAGKAANEFFSVTSGSRIRAEGITRILLTGNGRSRTLQLLVDSPSRLTVEDGGIHWRILIPVTVLVAFGAVLLWIAQLRRTLRVKTKLIREQVAHEAQLENRYRRLFARNLAAVFTWQPDGRIIDCNAAFAKMLGCKEPSQVIGSSYLSLLEENCREMLLDRLKHEDEIRVVTELKCANGRTVHLLENLTVVRCGYDLSFECTALDITQSRMDQMELRQARDAARREAEVDSLTGLPNRRSFSTLVQKTLASATRDGRSIGLLYVDLDGFKAVNDTLGHVTGDLVLQEVAALLKSQVQAGDMLCRVGGDEFALLLTRDESVANPVDLANKLLAVFDNPILIPDHEVRLGASIGISLFPLFASDYISLLQQADAAMYVAKRAGRNSTVLYNPEIGQDLHEKGRITSQLRGAVARGEIMLHFQPEFRLSDHRLMRFEALARWESPVLGKISPGVFIPIAETSGLIRELGAWLMEEACRKAADWQRQTGHPVPVAVNISALQLRSNSFVDEVTAMLKRTGLAPELLELEMTESIMMDQMECCRDKLEAFRNMGVRLALDDFGTGYSSLAYLYELPFDRLKVARCFLAGTHHKRAAVLLVQTVIRIGHSLGMKVVVEGIETEDELNLVQTLGADEVQGYLLGHPTMAPCDVIVKHLDAPHLGSTSLLSGNTPERSQTVA
jgi:diguanylate cyclase (GGDEF)-like protein/PAS domain S-box-containing protein